MNQIILKRIEETIIYIWLDFYVWSLLRMIMYQCLGLSLHQRRFFWNHKWFRIYYKYDIQIRRLLDTSVNPRTYIWLWIIHFKFQIFAGAHDHTRTFLLLFYLTACERQKEFNPVSKCSRFVVNAKKSPLALAKNVCRCQSRPITVTKRRRNVSIVNYIKT